MIFSYYYDVQKTHLLNCGFNVSSIHQQSNGSIQATFIAFIEEVLGEEVLKRESVQRTFTFRANQENRGDHNIDFLRQRFADENKWVFEIRNNTNIAEGVVLGLISQTATRNPLGFDIIHNSEAYSSQVKGSNLSQIDDNIKSPIVKQTMVDTTFSSAGYPYGFSSETAIHNSRLNIMEANEFRQKFIESIPPETPFVIQMNLAPETLNLKYTDDQFVSISIEDVGLFRAYPDRMTFLRSDHPPQDVVEIRFDETKTVESFYNSGFQNDSNLTIEGDGRNSLNIRYAGHHIHTTYNPSATPSEITMEGGIHNYDEGVLAAILREISEHDPNEEELEEAPEGSDKKDDEEKEESKPSAPEDNLPKNWVRHKIDNLLVYYNK